MPPRQISFKESIYPEGQITLHLLQSQTWETFQLITFLPLFPLQQEHHFRRHKSCFSSGHHSSLYCPLTSGHPHHHLCHDTSNWHSHTPSHTHHFSYRHHSCHYSTDQSQSCSSNSHYTAQETQLRKAKAYPRPSTPHKPHHSKTVIIQASPSDLKWLAK